ncbi:hypothetical protein J8L88_21845 [Aquimarina sp. MMG015]|uniref:hypothetical protein n=1 Tax=unclassified Aquimarina TaxID=2627091 RepID=UPI000E5186EF|nr:MULTISPECIES: hypothetical protein [unclassified Aquimarina]AXT57726.1 hypothetical protein D1815_18940 [Aquimarina sp. AD1]MBQ4805521.1 hypothetical protein [Aquimarina sp. MMG015]RKN17684.1 hypothetical protein D7035_14660 [Aquimarina sp. AD1]
MIKKEILFGFVTGILANAIGIILYILLFSELSIKETLKAAQQNNFLGSLIALGAILNLIIFFLFLKQNKPYRARGVLLATLIAAVSIAISKFS